MSTEKTIIYENNGLMIVHFIGVFLWIVCFFLGFNYWSNDIIVSLLVSLGVGGLLGVLVYGMTLYRPQTSRDSIFKERVLLLFYIITSIASFVFIYHLVTITATTKSEIQNYVANQKAEVEGYFADKSIAGSYEYYVDDRLNQLDVDLKRKRVSQSEIDDERLSVELDLKGKRNDKNEFDELRTQTFQIFLENCSKVVQWNWITVSSALKPIADGKSKIEAMLIELSNRADIGKSVPYTPAVKLSDSQIYRLNQISSNGQYLLSFLIVLVLQVMILLIYIRKKRRDKTPVTSVGDM